MQTCFIFVKKNLKKFSKSINYRKPGDYCHHTGKYRGTAHIICNLKLIRLMKPMYFFRTVPIMIIILSLKNQQTSLRGNWNVLGENTKNKRCFLFQFDKDGSEHVVTIYYNIKFIDSARFVASSLSHLVDSLAEVIHKIKCKN